MPHYKTYNYDQTKMIPISYAEQILPGSFEHTLSETVDIIDLSIFHDRFNNDDNGTCGLCETNLKKYRVALFLLVPKK